MNVMCTRFDCDIIICGPEIQSNRGIFTGVSKTRKQKSTKIKSSFWRDDTKKASKHDECDGRWLAGGWVADDSPLWPSSTDQFSDWNGLPSISAIRDQAIRQLTINKTHTTRQIDEWWVRRALPWPSPPPLPHCPNTECQRFNYKQVDFEQIDTQSNIVCLLNWPENASEVQCRLVGVIFKVSQQ